MGTVRTYAAGFGAGLSLVMASVFVLLVLGTLGTIKNWQDFGAPGDGQLVLADPLPAPRPAPQPAGAGGSSAPANPGPTVDALVRAARAGRGAAAAAGSSPARP